MLPYPIPAFTQPSDVHNLSISLPWSQQLRRRGDPRVRGVDVQLMPIVAGPFLNPVIDVDQDATLVDVFHGQDEEIANLVDLFRLTTCSPFIVVNHVYDTARTMRTIAAMINL